MLPSTSRCLVTGASDPGSVGFACAVALLNAGAACVTVTGRSQEGVAAAAAVLKLQTEQHAAAGGTSGVVFGVVGDLKDPERMTHVVEEAASLMGGGVDILIVSGGNGGSEYLGLSATDPESYRLMHTMSVISPMILTHAAIAASATAIVMISSMAAETPWPDTAPYNTAKAAQNCLVQQLAFQYRNNNVRVNAVLPACIHSVKLDIMAGKKGVPVAEYAALRAQCHPMGRNGSVEEVANAVVFLASPASSFITGTLLPVDGGLHMSNWWNKPVMLAEYQGK